MIFSGGLRMTEEIIYFTSDGLRLAGALERTAGSRGAIIAHAHPLYGGDMDNPVVRAIQQAYLHQGLSTLRFNFRGVGASEGRFDNGVGERADVQAALTWAAGRGITDIDLVGYSFGAWVNAGIIAGYRRMVMISPPVAFMDFGPSVAIERLSLIVTGGRDEIAPPAMIAGYRSAWNSAAAFDVIPRADHFYTGFLKTLEDIVAATI
jgi:alpha/beta superfamily hydrolase